MIIAATGHRPDKLGSDHHGRLLGVARVYLQQQNPDKVISGMALGWDQIFAEAAITLNIPVQAAIPFVGQECIWPRPAQDRYHFILSHCAETIVVCQGGYSAHKMHDRNKWMVDHADRICALWDGSNGGTAHCVKYAKKVGKPIDNLWSVHRG